MSSQEATSRLRIKGWSEFQHYKDRAPPWIKLHKGLLDNFEYQCLPVASRALAPMIWLLASESTDGSIDFNVRKIAFRLRQSESEVADGLKPLIDAGFVEVDGCASSALAARTHNAMLETETETEERTEGERETERAPRKRAAKKSTDRPDDVSEQVWEDWHTLRKAKRAPITDTVVQRIRAEASKVSMTLEDALRTCCARGWQGFEAEWIEKERRSVQPQAYGKPAVHPSFLNFGSRGDVIDA